MIIKCFAIMVMVTYCQAGGYIQIEDPEFTITGPECSSITYYPGVDQEISLTITITNSGTYALTASSADTTNFEIQFYVYPLPNDVSGHVNQQPEGDSDTGGYMHMPSSEFTVTSGSLEDEIVVNGGTVEASGTTIIQVPSDYCSSYQQLCVSLILTRTAVNAGATTEGGDTQIGTCVDFGCTPNVIGTLDCDGPPDDDGDGDGDCDGSGATRTVMTAMVVFLIIICDVFITFM